MTIKTGGELWGLDYGENGTPFVQVVAKSTLTSAGLDYGMNGLPFVASEGTYTPPDPEPPTSRENYIMIIMT